MENARARLNVPLNKFPLVFCAEHAQDGAGARRRRPRDAAGGRGANGRRTQQVRFCGGLGGLKRKGQDALDLDLGEIEDADEFRERTAAKLSGQDGLPNGEATVAEEKLVGTRRDGGRENHGIDFRCLAVRLRPRDLALVEQEFEQLRANAGCQHVEGMNQELLPAGFEESLRSLLGWHDQKLRQDNGVNGVHGLPPGKMAENPAAQRA